MRFLVAFLVPTFMLSVVQAEYRAFLLRIEKLDNPAISHEFLSTLDPFQYVGYFPIQADERILYVKTWMCKGRTDNRPICPNPQDSAPTEGDNAAGVPAPATPKN